MVDNMGLATNNQKWLKNHEKKCWEINKLAFWVGFSLGSFS